MYQNKKYYAKTMLVWTIILVGILYVANMLVTIGLAIDIHPSRLIFLVTDLVAPMEILVPLILALFIVAFTYNISKNKFDAKKERNFLRLSTVLFVIFLFYSWCIAMDYIIGGIIDAVNRVVATSVFEILFGVVCLGALIVATFLFLKNGYKPIYYFVIFDQDVVPTKETKVLESKPIESKPEEPKKDEERPEEKKPE